MSPCKDLATLNVVNGREPCECTHIGILMIEVSYNTLLGRNENDIGEKTRDALTSMWRQDSEVTGA